MTEHQRLYGPGLLLTITEQLTTHGDMTTTHLLESICKMCRVESLGERSNLYHRMMRGVRTLYTLNQVSLSELKTDRNTKRYRICLANSSPQKPL